MSSAVVSLSNDMGRSLNKLDVEVKGVEREPDHIGRLLRDAELRLGARVAERLGAAGFSDLRPAVLNVGRLVGEDGARVTDLAERAQLTKPTVVHAVDELVRLGYAERRPHPTDGRGRLVVPTERGVAALRTARAAIAEIEEEWAAAIGARRWAALRGGLEHLQAHL